MDTDTSTLRYTGVPNESAGRYFQFEPALDSASGHWARGETRSLDKIVVDGVIEKMPDWFDGGSPGETEQTQSETSDPNLTIQAGEPTN